MQVIVTGANGLLGSNIVQTSTAEGYETIGTYHTHPPSFSIDLHQLDIRDHNWYRLLLRRYDPDVVINCAAMTDVDGCEKQPERAYAINGQAPGDLAAVCAEKGARFVHVSTDYVFDGDASDPYPESAEPNPIQVYGDSKLAGESNVRSVEGDPLIVRLSFVYGVHGATGELTGFPGWVRDELRQRNSVPLFTDQYVTPSRAGQVADTILTMLEMRLSGTYHIACRSCVTPYRFGDELRERLNASTDLLSRGSQADVSRNADRPRYTCLAVSKVESHLEREQPTLSEDLDAIIDGIV